MDMRLCYEAGAVLFWLLFAYLFMDKFLFRGQLGEICFGRHAAAWRSPAGCGRLVRSGEGGTEEGTWTGERENGQERDSDSREKAGRKSFHLSRRR